MSVKVMIIDGSADFRSLLMHHVTTHWPDAVISAYDPTAAGHLPDEFSGAGNDIVLLGDEHGERDGVEVLRRFTRRAAFPAVVYFGNRWEKQAALKADADGFFDRENLNHDALAIRLSDILVAREQVASTGSLFMGDERTGIHPLIRGYRFIEKLSSSSHSAVYRAERVANGEQVVLKVLNQVPEVSDGIGAFDRFLQEYELIADLDHPNIVRIHDLGVGDTHAHIVMEYLDGGDLKQRIAAGIPRQQAVDYLRQIASAMARIHEVGILHRDLKPGNIMLRRDGSLALIDFGLAKRMRLKLEITGTGEIFGTPYYMSPEQGHAKRIDQRSDIYSLGIIFYEMLTGEKPFRADSALSIVYLHANAPVPLLPLRLAEHQALINMMLAKDPANRLGSAEEIIEWL
ncbi:MAG: serine/threonine-protein kinase [Pseudomonadota bacterium]